MLSCSGTASSPARCLICFFFSSRRRHTRLQGDWSSDVCSSDLVFEVHAVEPRQVLVDRLGVLGGLEVGVAHEVPHFGVGLDDLVDQVDGGLVLGDVLLEFLDQRGPLLLLGVDGADVTEQIAKGIAAKCVFNPAPLLGVGTAFEIARRRADRSEEHTSELQSPCNLVCRLLLEKKQNLEVTPNATIRRKDLCPHPNCLLHVQHPLHSACCLLSYSVGYTGGSPCDRHTHRCLADL